MDSRPLMLLPLPASEALQHNNGNLHGSQGLLQNLLDLGEAFLASEIGEEDLEDLQAKLSAARSRDYGTIRELQKKIEELSGMSAMVSRLKEDLREEKEKAKEEAEDLTQEMAELRYQLMERVDEERELRARIEEASLRRISELESQLKHAWKEIMNLQGAKQCIEVQSQSRLLEIQHLKAAFEESKSIQENLKLEKQETKNQLDELQSKVKTLEINLSDANGQLLAAEDKICELKEVLVKLKNTHEVQLLDEKKQKEETMELEMMKAEIYVPDQDFSYPLLTEEHQNNYLKHEVKAMQSLIADFKLQLQLLAINYHNAKDELPQMRDANTGTGYENIEMTDGKASEDNNRHILINYNDKKLHPPWTLQEVVEIVDEITEEMTKLLRILLKSPHSRKADFLYSLASRLQLWSNIPQKALPERMMKNGVLAEWGDLLVDLVAQSRRELHSLQQKLWDLETELDIAKNARADLATFSKEPRCTKEELTKTESYYSTQLSDKEHVITDLEGKLEQCNKDLLQSQERVKEMEGSNDLLHGLVRRLELETERLKSLWDLEKNALEERMYEQNDSMQKERAKANKEVDKLEKVVAELRCRLAENEQELEELVDANDLNIDAVVAAKLRQLEQKLRNSQSNEQDLQAERAELASQVVWLQAKLEEAERELEAQNEQHVEALIQYEEERRLLEFELEAGKQSLQKKNSSSFPILKENIIALESELEPSRGMDFHSAEHEQLEKTVELLKQKILDSEQILASQQESVLLQKEINRSLVKHAALLDSELVLVREKLAASEAEVQEMESLIGSLQDELLLVRIESVQVQDDADREEKRTNRREEEYEQLKVSLNETISSLQRDLVSSQNREKEACFQVKKMGLELSVAKEEVVKSELRLQKYLKQKDELLGAEERRLEVEHNLYRRTEELRILESEKMELQRLLKHTRVIRDQLEQERDGLKAALTEMENRFSTK